ncbi:MAG: dTDP-4-dehydrorhamnose reductase [Pseudomonadota bacterium]
MRVLITGGDGQLGHSLRRETADLSWSVTVCNRTELDITDAARVDAAVAELQPQLVINAAAYTAVDRAESEREAAFAVNAHGAGHLAQAAAAVGAACFHVSTDYVFSGESDTAYRETDAPAPCGVYGESKLAGEVAVAEANPHHLILRTAWVFSEQGANFVKAMLRLGQARDELGVVDDQVGGPTYAGDIARTLITLAHRVHADDAKDTLAAFPWGTYHYCGLPYVSWHGFATAIFERVAARGLFDVPTVRSITTAEYPTAARRPANSRLDTHELTQAFGIQPGDWAAALDPIDRFLVARS